MDQRSLDDLIRLRRPGETLPQPFYRDPAVLEREMERVFPGQWLLLDHASRIPDRGDFFIFEIAGESIVVVRGEQGAIHAFYNVCRHRGSRVCLEKQGHTRRFVCPYHAWTYRLDGSLASAPLMGKEFDPSRHGLHRCHVRVLDGLIFINVGSGEPRDFDTEVAPLLSYLRVHGLASAKIAHRELYPTEANWKLVVDNFFECYHCRPSHPEFCTVHSKAKVIALGAGPGSGSEEAMAAFREEFDAWEAVAKSLGHPTGLFGDSPGATPYCRMGERLPIGRGFLSESPDGKPLAPLMGEFKEYDGGQTVVTFNPLGTLMMTNDVAVLFRFTPTGPVTTDVEVVWLVDADAREGVDYDLKRVSWMWDVTTRQDQKITEDNQAGVNSRRYQPGPRSQLEGVLEQISDWYLRQMA